MVLLFTLLILIKHCWDGVFGITQFVLSILDKTFALTIFQSEPSFVLYSILRLVTFKLFHFINSVVPGSQISPPFGDNTVIKVSSSGTLLFKPGIVIFERSDEFDVLIPKITIKDSIIRVK